MTPLGWLGHKTSTQQQRTFTLLKVFNLLIDVLIQLIKQGKETAKLSFLAGSFKVI